MVSRSRTFRHRAFHRAPVGAPPGTLQAAADAHATTLALIAFDGESLVERSGKLEDLEPFLSAGPGRAVRWLDVTGIGNTEVIEAVGRRFGLHPLAIEDVVHVHQRAKVEAFPNHIFVTLRMIERAPTPGGRIETEQFSLFIGDGWLLTFQERPGDVFGPARDRLRAARGKIRNSGADYLAYLLLDAIVDTAFPVLESYDLELDVLEARIVSGNDSGVVAALHHVRADLMQLRRAIWPMREAMATLVREEAPQFSDETRVYLRDCHDHAVQLLELVESWREICASLMDLHLSSVGLRTNEIMRMLTVISVLFIPMSFVTGLYGMNFDPAVSPFNMPELRWALGYPFALCLIASIGGGFFFFFRRRGYLRPIEGALAPPGSGRGGETRS